MLHGTEYHAVSAIFSGIPNVSQLATLINTEAIVKIAILIVILVTQTLYLLASPAILPHISFTQVQLSAKRFVEMEKFSVHIPVMMAIW